MIPLTQITNTEVFAFIAVPAFKLLSRKASLINRFDARIHETQEIGGDRWREVSYLRYPLCGFNFEVRNQNIASDEWN